MKDKLTKRINKGNPAIAIGKNCIPDQTRPTKHRTETTCKYLFHFNGSLANQMTNGKLNGNNMRDAGFQAITS
jgi:hypothetical protein